MQTVLSTKILSTAQKNLLLNSGIGLVEYDAIKICFLDFTIENNIPNGIITSKNAARAIIDRKLNIEKCFCVGEKTAEELKQHDYFIAETASYAEDLANKISEKYSNDNFISFCGNLRREDLPQILKKNKIGLTEVEVYQTHLNPINFSGKFNGVMFYSPSGVRSFIQANEPQFEWAFCIGNTTAKEAGKYTNKIITATKPSIENLIVQVVKKFKL